MTLHMGATKMAPSQYSGCFLCTNTATAPPIDSPIKYLFFSLFSFFSARNNVLNKLNSRNLNFWPLESQIIVRKWINYQLWKWRTKNSRQLRYRSSKHSLVTQRTSHVLHNQPRKLHILPLPISLHYLFKIKTQFLFFIF